MILLDTNVISEMMKKSPSISVMSWIDRQEVTQLFISTITMAEIFYGINAFPDGVRRQSIEDAFNKTIRSAFKHRILSFNEPASHIYGKIMGQRKALGKPMSVLDGQIAAIAISENAALATRNICDFSDCDLEVIDPFTC